MDYLNKNANNGFIPVFTWYQMLQSNPANCTNEADKDFSNRNNTATLHAYFSDLNF